MSTPQNLSNAALQAAYYRAVNEDVSRRLAEEIVRRVESDTWDQSDTAPADAYDEIED